MIKHINKGDIINEADRCKKCLGRKTIQEQKIIEVKITPGMRENQKIVFYGEGDQEPGIEPGDIVLVVKTKHHEIFERKGDDLFMTKYVHYYSLFIISLQYFLQYYLLFRTVTLKQSLCGLTITIKHLDGKDIVLTTSPSEVIQPGFYI